MEYFKKVSNERERSWIETGSKGKLSRLENVKIVNVSRVPLIATGDSGAR